MGSRGWISTVTQQTIKLFNGLVMNLLIPDQIPRFWEVIKYAAVNAGYVEDEYVPRFLNRLLYLLLSGKSQCFIRLNEERRLQMVLVTTIINDPLRDEKTLFIAYVYSFEKASQGIWQADLEVLKKFAIGSGCKYITTLVMNERAAGLCEKAGMTLRSWNYQSEVGGV